MHQKGPTHFHSRVEQLFWLLSKACVCKLEISKEEGQSWYLVDTTTFNIDDKSRDCQNIYTANNCDRYRDEI